jgi:hypothetical protein
MLDKVAAIPGVASAAFTENLTAGTVCVEHMSIEVEGQAPPAGGDTPPARRNKYVSPATSTSWERE